MPCGVRGGYAWWTGGWTKALIPKLGGEGTGVREAGRARGGGCKGFGSGGVGGRHGPQGRSISQRVVFLSFLTRTKRRKMAFFEGCPVGWGGYPPELAWWTGG